MNTHRHCRSLHDRIPLMTQLRLCKPQQWDTPCVTRLCCKYNWHTAYPLPKAYLQQSPSPMWLWAHFIKGVDSDAWSCKKQKYPKRRLLLCRSNWVTDVANGILRVPVFLCAMCTCTKLIQISHDQYPTGRWHYRHPGAAAVRSCASLSCPRFSAVGWYPTQHTTIRGRAVKDQS